MFFFLAGAVDAFSDVPRAETHGAWPFLRIESLRQDVKRCQKT